MNYNISTYIFPEIKIPLLFDFGLDYDIYNVIFLAFIHFFILSVFILGIIIFFNKIFLKIKEKKENLIKDKFENQLTEYLFDDDFPIHEKIIINTRLQKKYLIEVIINFYANYKGEAKNKLRKLYFDLQLNAISQKKIHSLFWYRKINGLRELVAMKIKWENTKILKFLESKNTILRLESQMALMKLLPSVPFAFIDSIKNNLSEWEQLNIYEMIKEQEIEAPEFTLWLDTKNISVIIFSLKMIRFLKQVSQYEQVYKILQHENSTVRIETIKTLGEISNIEDTNRFIKIYPKFEQLEKNAFIKSFENLFSPEHIPFLLSLLSSANFEIKMAVCYALKNIGKEGKEAMYNYEKTNIEIGPFVLHVSDERIING